MEISKENYEEYFLLYADDELTEQERREVQLFVESHPEYQQEFFDILSTVQQAPDLFLADKTFLFKDRSDSFIDEKNFEEKFILYHDNELNEEEQSFVAHFLKKNPRYEEAFHLIGRAQLAPDAGIRFPGINLLYRKPARSLYLNIARYAAAAILAGLMVWFGANIISPGPSGHPDKVAVKSTDGPKISGEQLSSGEDAQAVGDHQKDVPETPSAPEKVPIDKLPAAREVIHKIAIHSPTGTTPNHTMAENTQVAEPAIGEPEPARETAGINYRLSDSFEKSEISQLAERVSAAGVLAPDLTAKSAPASDEGVSFPDERNGEFVLDGFQDESLKRSKLGIFVKKVQRTINRNNPINRFLNSENTD